MLYDSLPKNEAVVDFKAVGETTGETYEGQFTVMCVLNMAGRHSLELEKTRLQADYANPSRGLAGIAISLATVRAKVLEAPAWWKNSDEGSLIIDENVILSLYDKCNEVEANWRKELKKESEVAKATLDEKSTEATGTE
jgi:hypothetical protein